MALPVSCWLRIDSSLIKLCITLELPCGPPFMFALETTDFLFSFSCFFPVRWAEAEFIAAALIR